MSTVGKVFDSISRTKAQLVDFYGVPTLTKGKPMSLFSVLFFTVVLSAIIKIYTQEDDNLSFVKTFLSCFAAQLAVWLVNQYALTSLSPRAQAAVVLILSFILTGLIVNYLVSTTFKKVVAITLTFFLVQAVIVAAIVSLVWQNSN